MLYKDAGSTPGSAIEDVDVKTGTVTGYFAIFGNVDSDGDIIMPGAFTRTLNNNYKRIKHLNQHNPHEPLSATKNDNLKVYVDRKGLKYESTFSKTTWGLNAIKLVEDGVLDENSIGYEVVSYRDHDTLTTMRWGQKVPVKELHELKLWEGSLVTWGANSKASVDGVKSFNKDQCISKMDTVLRAIKNGKYEGDEVFEMLEIYFEQLKQQFIDLSASSTQPAASAPDPQKGVKSDDFDETEEAIALLKLHNYLLTTN